MPLKLEVRSGELILASQVKALEAGDVSAVLESWHADCRNFPGQISEIVQDAAYNWDWHSVLDRATGIALGLQVEEHEGICGMLAMDLNGRTQKGDSCVDIIFISKRPRNFKVFPLQSVGTNLVVAAIELSIEYGMNGRARIHEALKGVEGKSPSKLYRELGFDLIDGLSMKHADELELTAESAEELLRRYTNE